MPRADQNTLTARPARALLAAFATAAVFSPAFAAWPPEPGDTPPPPPPPPPETPIECPDTTFAGWSSVGKTGLDDHVWDLVAVGEGSDLGPALYACGNFLQADGITVNHIAKWDGSSWSPLYGPDATGLDNVCTSLALSPNEDAIYAGGSFEKAGGVPVFRSARWDGNDWTTEPLQLDTLGSPNSAAYALEHAQLVGDPSSPLEVVVGGDFPSGGTGGISLLFNGLAWWQKGSFGNFGYPDVGVDNLGHNDFIMDLERYDGELYAAGSFGKIGALKTPNIALVRNLKTFEALDAGIGISPANHVVEDMEVHDGSLYATGLFDQASGVWASNLTRWDGETWTDVADGLNQIGEGLKSANIGDGTALYVVGFFNEVGKPMWPQSPPPTGTPVPAQHIARYENGQWKNLLDGLGPYNFGENLENPNHGMVAEPWDDDEGSCLYVGGRFQTAGMIAAENIARWCCFAEAFKSERKIHFQSEIGGILFDVTDDGDGLPETIRCGEDRRVYELEPDSETEACGLRIRIGTERADEISMIDSTTPTIVFGGPGDDALYGSLHADLLFGAAGSDQLYGDDGDDRLHGGEGADELDGGRGEDELSPGPS